MGGRIAALRLRLHCFLVLSLFNFLLRWVPPLTEKWRLDFPKRLDFPNVPNIFRILRKCFDFVDFPNVPNIFCILCEFFIFLDKDVASGSPSEDVGDDVGEDFGDDVGDDCCEDVGESDGILIIAASVTFSANISLSLSK